MLQACSEPPSEIEGWTPDAQLGSVLQTVEVYSTRLQRCGGAVPGAEGCAASGVEPPATRTVAGVALLNPGHSPADCPQAPPRCCSATAGLVGAEQGRAEVQRGGDPAAVPSRALRRDPQPGEPVAPGEGMCLVRCLGLSGMPVRCVQPLARGRGSLILNGSVGRTERYSP